MIETPAHGKKPRGRPRDASSEERVIEAAIALLLEAGVAACTVEAVSRRSGVSKPSIYRRWPQRTALAIEAIARHIDHQVPVDDTGDTAEDLVQAVVRISEQYRGRDGAVFAELLAAAVLEPGTSDLLKARFFAGRRETLRGLWARGVNRGQLDPLVDPELMIDLLFGPATFRLLLDGEPVDPATAESLARAALRGFVPIKPKN